MSIRFTIMVANLNASSADVLTPDPHKLTYVTNVKFFSSLIIIWNVSPYGTGRYILYKLHSIMH